MSDRTTILTISGMSCNGCVQAVRRSLSKLEGVSSVEVMLDPGQAVVTYDAERVSLDDLRGRVLQIGYGVDGAAPASLP